MSPIQAPAALTLKRKMVAGTLARTAVTVSSLVLLHDAIISSLVFRPYRLRSSQLFLSESMCTRVGEISRGR